jgi:glutathione peroxidase
MFEKVDVNGDNAAPLFKYLKSEQSGLITDDIKWNFTKFLIDKNGKPIDRYASQTTPKKIAKDVEKALNS